MTDESAFIKAIAANPADTLRPLVYADWLDERGDPRGRLLRVWVDLSWRASHAGSRFCFLLNEYRQLMRAADPDWRREFGAARRWVDGQLAEELVRGYLRYVERLSPPRGVVLPGKARWFEEGGQLCGWLVSYVRGPSEIERRAGGFHGDERFELVAFVQPEFGWVYGVGPRGAGPTLRRYDVASGQGCAF